MTGHRVGHLLADAVREDDGQRLRVRAIGVNEEADVLSGGRASEQGGNEGNGGDDTLGKARQKQKTFGGPMT